MGCSAPVIVVAIILLEHICVASMMSMTVAAFIRGANSMQDWPCCVYSFGVNQAEMQQSMEAFASWAVRTV